MDSHGTGELRRTFDTCDEVREEIARSEARMADLRTKGEGPFTQGLEDGRRDALRELLTAMDTCTTPGHVHKTCGLRSVER